MNPSKRFVSVNWLRIFPLVALLSMLAQPADAQQKAFNWVAGEQEQVRLQPGMYYAVGPFAFQPNFMRQGVVKLAMQTTKPVFVGVVPQSAWNYVVQNPQTVQQLQYFCLKENVLQIDFNCPGLNTLDSPFVVVIHDLTDPNAQLGRVLLGGLGLYLHSKKLVEQAVAESGPTNNDVSITHYSWKCVENCDLPRFAWREVVKEKFPIMRVTKSYGPFTPERNGDVMRISLNSPVPMAFAAVSPEEAASLRANPELLNSVIAKSKCQQRAAQKMKVTCTFSLADGPQEIVLLPESGIQVPSNKKASFNISLPKCIENCNPK
jgi:hypothetical protein